MQSRKPLVGNFQHTAWYFMEVSHQKFGGFQKWGYTNSWMVDSGKSHLDMDDFKGYPYDSGNSRFSPLNHIAGLPYVRPYFGATSPEP